MSRRSARRSRVSDLTYIPLRENKALRRGATIVAILIAAALMLSLVLPFAVGSGGGNPLHGG